MVSSPSGVTIAEHPLIAVKLTILRDERTTPRNFRATLQELAGLLACEATRDLPTVTRPIQTPLAPHDGAKLDRPIVVVPILRAGLGLAEGMITLLGEASIGHIGLARDEETRRPRSYYLNLPPELPRAHVLLVDPMLATGHSACAAIAQLKAAGAQYLRFLCCVACPEGIAQLQSAHPDVPIFTAAIDPKLDERAYIVPGLGDAGDRYFGTQPH
jgi:uracil phosphoribosyltransferase